MSEIETLLAEIVSDATERHKQRAVEYFGALMLIADMAEDAGDLHIARIARKASRTMAVSAGNREGQT